MRGLKITAYLKPLAVRKAALSLVMAACSLALHSQTPDLFKITKPPIPSANGNGWQVDPRLGHLSSTIPIGEMPGEISFPISIAVSGAYTRRPGQLGGVAGTYVSYMGTHLSGCRIEATPGGAEYILEDGRTYSYPDDFTNTSSVFDAQMGATGSDPIFQAYGFTRPADRSKWLVSSDSKLITFSVGPTYNFGPKYNALIKSLNVSPDVLKYTCSSFSSYQSVAFLEYGILMDKDRARVFAAFQYAYNVPYWGTVETGVLYVPLCIVDRFGHYVTMKWTNGGPVRRLDVRNQRDQGFTVRMYNYFPPPGRYPKANNDLARIDFVNFRGPSALIKGYGIVEVPWSFNDGTIGQYRCIWNMNAIGNPAEVTIGCPESISQPSWSNQFGAASEPPVTMNDGIDTTTKKWSLGYNVYGNRINYIIDPALVKSTFSYQDYSTFQIPNGYETSAPAYTTPHVVRGVMAVNQVDTSASAGATKRFTWDRVINASPTIPNSIAVTYREWWNPETNSSSDRYEVFQYGDPATPSSGLNNPVDIGNGFLSNWRLFSNAGMELECVKQGSGSYGATNNYGRGCGLNMRLSVVKGFSHTKQGEPAQTVGYNTNEWPSYDITRRQIDVQAAPADAITWKMAQRQTFTYAALKGMLAPEQIAISNSTTFNPETGAMLPPGAVGTRNTWDTTNLLQLMDTNSDFGAVRDGTQFTYDSEGRPSTKQVYYTSGSNRLPWKTLTTSYDPGTGKPQTMRTDFQIDSGADAIQESREGFDSGHRPTRIVDEKGVATDMTYDLFGRPLSIARSGDASIAISYPDEWTKITTQVSKTTKEFFDGFGRLIKQELWAGGILVRTTVPTYDLHSRVVSVLETNAAGAARTRTKTYDLLDRVVSQTSFAGRRIDFAYTAEGLNSVITRSVDPLGLNLRTIIKKDFWGQVVSIQAPNGDVTSYSYDGLGNKTSTTITPTGGGPVQARTFTYDTRGRLISKWEPETGTQTFGNFNPLNQAQTLTEVGLNPANPSRIRTLNYDGLGRLRSQVGGDVSETFTYQGVLLAATSRTVGSDAVLQTFGYNGPGRRLSSETTTQGSFGPVSQFAYDTQGRLETLTYPSGSVVGYAYDPLDRVQAVTYNGQGLVPQITYDDWGNPWRRQFGSGAMDEWTYDASGIHVSQWAVGTVGGVPEARNYQFDMADRLTKAGEWGTLAYDANNRLTQATGFGLTNVLSHDAYTNNISSVTTSAGEVPPTLLNFTFNPMVDNHVPGETVNGGFTQAEKTNFGETTILGTGISSDGAMAMEWDPLGRMAYSHLMWGPTESYRYTASGLRITKVNTQDAGQNRSYAYTNTGQLLSEYTANPSPAWTRDVVYLGNLAIAEIDAIGTHELHSDHLGSPRVITGSEGTVEGTQAYGPYGELIQQTGYVPLTGYTGHLQTEPTGLIYMRGRFYSPAWHRFMNSDQGVDPNSLNQFAYVCGNPLMGTDPSGMRQVQGDGPVDGKEQSAADRKTTNDHAREAGRVTADARERQEAELKAQQELNLVLFGSIAPPTVKIKSVGAFAFGGAEGDFVEGGVFQGGIYEFDTALGPSSGVLTEAWVGGEGPVIGGGKISSTTPGEPIEKIATEGFFGFAGGGINAGPLGGVKVGIAIGRENWAGLYAEGHVGPFGGGLGGYFSW